MRDISGFVSTVKTEIINTISKRSLSEAVIIYFARLQGFLEMNLKRQLRDTNKKLPVHGFESEVKLAYSIGLISKFMKNDLLLIGKIRNCIVHYNSKGSKNGRSWHVGIDEEKINENVDKLLNDFSGFLKKFHNLKVMIHPTYNLGAVVLIMVAMIRTLLFPISKPFKIPIAPTEELYEFEKNDKSVSHKI